jgi:hypothetical protein
MCVAAPTQVRYTIQATATTGAFVDQKIWVRAHLHYTRVARAAVDAAERSLRK